MSDAAAPQTDRRPLAWCCIGAQKAATSTLFELLRRHPDLFVPPGKEEPLFHRPYEPADLDSYMARHFPASEVGGALAGTVTPQYMSSPDTAFRLHQAFPEARIIVLLRDPVRRAYSHYRMAVRRGREHRSFETAVAEQIAALGPSGPPDHPELDPDDEVSTYVWRGFYGHILTPWFDLFGGDRVHVALTGDLEGDPLGTVHDVYRFLGVEPYTSGEEGIRRHADPPRHRFPQLRRRVTGPLRRIGVLERIPGSVRERLGYRAEAILAKVAPAEPAAGGGEIDQETTARLRELYAEDGRILEKLLGRTLPWHDAP